MNLDSIPFGADLAWLVPGLALASFTLLALGLRRVRPLAALVSVLAIGSAFVVALGVLGDYLANGEQVFEWTWLRTGEREFRIGYSVDALSTMMLVLVSSVSLAVQVYSLEYMKGEPRFGWYFAAHSLFAASMLGLVLTQSLLFVYVTWELVGLCSYLLIGFWYERRSAAEAAKKAFITTRIGDVGLLIGIILLYLQTDSFQIREILEWAGQHEGEGITALAAFLLFLGAMGKSAQVPFHVWLPDAMEGPTPVSALIHAATMVVAGVFLVARMFELFLAAPAVLWFVAGIGAVTALMAGIQAVAEADFKRILAYSTVSQLGLMMLALGAAGLAHEESPAGALFHLLSHGYFKALLFLTAGVTLHAIGHHAATIHQVRGLGRKAKFTSFVLIVGSLSMAGIPPLSGFFSKEEVLAAPLAAGGIGGWLLFAAAMGASFLSALYMTRLALVVIRGEPHGEGEHLHDPPLAMRVPLAVLAVLAIGVGLVLALAWDINEFLGAEGYHVNWPLAIASVLTAAVAIAIGWRIYGNRTEAPESLRAALGPLPRWAGQRFYFDRVYQSLVDNVALGAARLVALFDRKVVNDVGINGTGSLPTVAGAALRIIQTGRIYNYALAFAVGAIVLAFAAMMARS